MASKRDMIEPIANRPRSKEPSKGPLKELRDIMNMTKAKMPLGEMSYHNDLSSLMPKTTTAFMNGKHINFIPDGPHKVIAKREINGISQNLKNEKTGGENRAPETIGRNEMAKIGSSMGNPNKADPVKCFPRNENIKSGSFQMQPPIKKPTIQIPDSAKDPPKKSQISTTPSNVKNTQSQIQSKQDKNSMPIPQNPLSSSVKQQQSTNTNSNTAEAKQKKNLSIRIPENSPKAQQVKLFQFKSLSTKHANEQKINIEQQIAPGVLPLQPACNIVIPNHEPAKCSLKRNGVVRAYAAITNQGLVRYFFY